MVGLRLATDLLEVDELEDVRMGEDVMTPGPARPPKLEPEGLDESPHVRERDVREIAASDPRQESLRIHGGHASGERGRGLALLMSATPVGGISVLPLEPIWLE